MDAAAVAATDTSYGIGEIDDECKWEEGGMNEAQERASPQQRRRDEGMQRATQRERRMKKEVKDEKTHEVNAGPLVDVKAKKSHE